MRGSLAIIGLGLTIGAVWTSGPGALTFKPTPFAASPAPVPATPRSKSDTYVLALSWEPAFCESAERRPECRHQTGSRADGRQLSLHGLWPKAEYCGVPPGLIDDDKSGHWASLPVPDLSTAIVAALALAMPGTQSQLDRHEWVKHGTCSGLSAETYFSRALDLTAEFNRSSAGALLASHMGQQLRASELASAMDRSFGTEAGDRLTVSCRQDGGRQLIEEITVALSGDITRDSLADLVAKALPVDRGCMEGVVDPVGLQ
jgi:ribonuclease T2